MVSTKDAICALKIIRPKLVFLTAKSGAGKTYLSKRLSGYKVLELDVVVRRLAKRFGIQERKAFSMYKSRQPEHIMKAFVEEIHKFFKQNKTQPIVVDGAISDAGLIRRVFSGDYSVFTFVYLYPTDVPAYASRMMKRYILEKKKGIRNLSIWPEVTPELEAEPFNSRKLLAFINRMARESKSKSKERYDYFVKQGFTIYRVNV